jgi:hypothetical protein
MATSSTLLSVRRKLYSMFLMSGGRGNGLGAGGRGRVCTIGGLASFGTRPEAVPGGSDGWDIAAVCSRGLDIWKETRLVKKASFYVG